MNSFQFTERLHRIFTIAKSLINEDEAIQPIHLFFGACKEGSGVCLELYLYLTQELGNHFLNQFNANNQQTYESIQIHGYNVSLLTNEVVKKAEQKMKRFGQTYLNEGHLLSALLEVERSFIQYLDQNRIREILSIVASPRDLIISLENDLKPLKTKEGFIVRKVTLEDFQMLRLFVQTEFGNAWIESIQNGFNLSKLPIYIALEKGRIVGFACYDVVRNKKGIFGPMGTSRHARSRGIGSELLHHCLKEMKSIGYEYVMIDQAGPIEFYEKNCQAQLIPLTKSV